MRLLRVDIEKFRSIEEQWIPAEGLVVLYGANSSGKTSVLEAVAHVITQAGEVRSDPGAEDEDFVLGSVWFELPAAAVAGSEDARFFVSLLRGEHSKPTMFGKSIQCPWEWLDDSARKRLAAADLGDAVSIVADALAADGDADGVADRQLLARSLFDPRAVYFVAELANVSLNVYGPSLPTEAAEAATRIAARAGDDRLSGVAANLVSQGWAHIGWVATGSFAWAEFAASFPPVIALDGDIESLSAELERAVVSVHDVLWRSPLEVIGSYPEFGGVQTVEGEYYQIGEVREPVRYAADPWLETMSSDGQIVGPELFAPPYNHSEWYRVRHSVLAAAQTIAAEANRVAPGFVTEQGTIGIEVLGLKSRAAGTYGRPTKAAAE